MIQHHTAPPPPADSPHTDRRTILRLGALGLGALAFPGALAAQAQRGFSHGVASGEPGQDRVLLWTRHAPNDPQAETRLDWEVSETIDFAKVVAGGSVTASGERDGCVKPVATGLAPGRWYYYRFTAPSGERSAIGRTRTLPQGRAEKFRLAAFSCSNLGFGWFNAYAHAAQRNDIDLLVHLGDYLYEYKAGEYPSKKQALAVRVLDPQNEIVALADYRLRHAAYRADPDLQRLHQLFPMIVMWDDHESANDSWKDGAENHQRETEGPWEARKIAAKRAFREWLPVSDDDWASYDIGDLATLVRLDTRLAGRDKPFELPEVLAGVAPAGREAAVVRFRDGPWQDPARTLLGERQEQWVSKTLATSRRSGKTWQILAQQVIMGELVLPLVVSETMPTDTPAQVSERIANGAIGSRLGLPVNLDAWDGYPPARARLLKAARSADANLLVLAGDSHTAWSFDLAHGKQPAGVEFAVSSVTSPGIERSVGWLDPARFAREAVARNPGLKWADTARRGYLTVELTKAAASTEFVFMDTIRERSTRLSGTHRLSVAAGSNKLA